MAAKSGHQSSGTGRWIAIEGPSQSAPDHAKNLAWLAALVGGADDAIIAKDLEGTILVWNAAAERIYGYTSAEAVGRPIAMLVPPEAWDEYEQMMERVRSGERIRGLETVRLRKDGTRVQVSLTIAAMMDSDGGVIGAAVTVRDLTDRKRSEAEIVKGRARLRAILDTAADAIITIDGRGLIQTFNPATERLFGYTAAELVGENVNMLMPPPFRAEHDGYLARYKQTGEKRIIGIGREVQARRKDGTVFPVDLAVSEVEPGTLFTGIIRDLTDRKFLEAKLLQTDRMATIGIVAAGLGHDINNLLMMLRLSIDVLSTCSLSPTGVAAVERQRSAIGYMRDLVRGLQLIALDPENRGDGTSRTTCLADWSPATKALLETLKRPGVAIELKIPPGLPDVGMASHHLTQVVFNLVGNALNAMGDAPSAGDGLVRIAARRGPGKECVRLQVTDNGGGMPPEVLERVFEPLFTTRSERGGMGLGLALVKRLVLEAGGKVSIKSEPRTGTTVTVDLRAASEAAEEPVVADGFCAVVSLPDARAAVLVRRVLERLGAPVRDERDLSVAMLRVVDLRTPTISTACVRRSRVR